MTVAPDTLDARLRELERRLATLETAPRAPHTSILNDAGDVVTTLSKDGLNIVDGAIIVGGGPVRALDIADAYGQVEDAALTTTHTAHAPAVITVPSWANTAFVFAWTVFQMVNSTGSVQGQRYRVTVDGSPSSGVWSNDVQPGGTMNATDMTRRILTRGVDLGSTITAESVVGVHLGTNNDNVVRTRAIAFFMR